MSEVRVVIDPPIGRLVLDRPDRRNAMSAEMWRTLQRSCAELENRIDVAAVIVEGAGDDFCSGADISQFEDVFIDLVSARSYLNDIEHALNALNNLDRPTVAKIHGYAVGGGIAIALACDIRIAAETAHIAIPPAKLGLLYGPAETRLLVETVGPAIARDLLFSGRAVTAAEALELGLVNRVVQDAELAEAVDTQARVWTRLSSGSIRGAKKAVRAALDSKYAELRSLMEAAAMSADFREGRSAFKNKRQPNFSRGT